MLRALSSASLRGSRGSLSAPTSQSRSDIPTPKGSRSGSLTSFDAKLDGKARSDTPTPKGSRSGSLTSLDGDPQVQFRVSRVSRASSTASADSPHERSRSRSSLVRGSKKHTFLGSLKLGGKLPLIRRRRGGASDADNLLEESSFLEESTFFDSPLQESISILRRLQERLESNRHRQDELQAVEHVLRLLNSPDLQDTRPMNQLIADGHVQADEETEDFLDAMQWMKSKRNDSSRRKVRKWCVTYTTRRRLSQNACACGSFS